MKALAALVLAAAAVPATAQEIDGRWQISIERASRRTDDGGTVARRGFEGTLVLVTAGQKVEGTLALPGSPVPEFALSGTVDAGRVRAVTEWREVEIASVVSTTFDPDSSNNMDTVNNVIQGGAGKGKNPK